jgi:hypothetical protein
MARTLAACLILSLPLAARAGDDDPTLEVLDQAIRAHGGEKNLARLQTAIRTSQGSTTAFGKDIPFTEELIVQLPDRFRQTIELGGGQKGRLLRVLNGDRAWQSTGGAVGVVPSERVTELRGEAYLLWLLTLLPLRNEAGFEALPLAESKVFDRPAAGIKVKRKGQADVSLYFDKATHLLVKMQRKITEADQSLEQEYLYGDHKEFDGVRLPTRISEMRNGKRFTEQTGVSYKFPRSPDETAFGKP